MSFPPPIAASAAAPPHAGGVIAPPPWEDTPPPRRRTVPIAVVALAAVVAVVIGAGVYWLQRDDEPARAVAGTNAIVVWDPTVNNAIVHDLDGTALRTYSLPAGFRPDVGARVGTSMLLTAGDDEWKSISMVDGTIVDLDVPEGLTVVASYRTDDFALFTHPVHGGVVAVDVRSGRPTRVSNLLDVDAEQGGYVATADAFLFSQYETGDTIVVPRTGDPREAWLIPSVVLDVEGDLTVAIDRSDRTQVFLHEHGAVVATVDAGGVVVAAAIGPDGTALAVLDTGLFVRVDPDARAAETVGDLGRGASFGLGLQERGLFVIAEDGGSDLIDSNGDIVAHFDLVSRDDGELAPLVARTSVGLGAPCLVLSADGSPLNDSSAIVVDAATGAVVAKPGLFAGLAESDSHCIVLDGAAGAADRPAEVTVDGTKSTFPGFRVVVAAAPDGSTVVALDNSGAAGPLVLLDVATGSATALDIPGLAWYVQL